MVDQPRLIFLAVGDKAAALSIESIISSETSSSVKKRMLHLDRIESTKNTGLKRIKKDFFRGATGR